MRYASFTFTIIISFNLAFALLPSSSLFSNLSHRLGESSRYLFFILSFVVGLIILWMLYQVKQCFSVHDDNQDNKHRLFSHPALTVFLYFLLVFLVFYSFPISSFNKLIYHGDFPYQYYVSIRNLEMLKEGILFGWEKNFLGGYPSFLDFSKDLSPIFFPFYFMFPPPVAFHILVVLLILLLPVTFSWWAGVFLEDKKLATFASHIFLVYMILNFRALTIGMVAVLAGLSLFFLGSGAFRSASSTKKSWLLLISLITLTLQLHIHASFFLYTVFFLILDLFFHYRFDKLLKKRCLFFIILIPAIIPYLMMHLSVRSVAIPSSKIVEEGVFYSLISFCSNLYQVHRWSEWGTYGFFLLIFISVLFIHKRPRSIQFILITGLLYFLFSLFKTAPHIGFALSRNDHILAPMACLLGSYLLSQYSLKSIIALTTGLGCFLLFSYQPIPKRIEHIDPDFFAPLCKMVKKMDTDRILAENAARWNAVYEGKRSEKSWLPHYVPYLQMTSGTSYLSNPGADPYHYSQFRLNTLTSGTFNGVQLENISPDILAKHLTRWRVHTLIVWSHEAITYFQKYPRLFKYRGHYKDFYVFWINRKTNREVTLIGPGHAEVLSTTRHDLTISLQRVLKGSSVVLNQNFSPAWETEDASITVYDKEGLFAFNIPDNGNMTLRFKFKNPLTLFVLSFSLAVILAILLLVLFK